MIFNPKKKQRTPDHVSMVNGSYTFDCVKSIKYLGLWYDQKASDKFMVKEVANKATKVMHWLISFVARQKWTHPHMRMVL